MVNSKAWPIEITTGNLTIHWRLDRLAVVPGIPIVGFPDLTRFTIKLGQVGEHNPLEIVEGASIILELQVRL